MNGQEYLQQLEQRLAHYYDKKPLPKAPAFVLAAELNAADEGYFIVPSLKTYSVQHNEYLYAAHFDKKQRSRTPRVLMITNDPDHAKVVVRIQVKK